jgi:hypothetical protein
MAVPVKMGKPYPPVEGGSGEVSQTYSTTALFPFNHLTVAVLQD